MFKIETKRSSEINNVEKKDISRVAEVVVLLPSALAAGYAAAKVITEGINQVKREK